MNAVIEVDGLRKLYGATRAVDDVSFTVYEGEIFGLLGPNGAGKTTTMECVEGIRKPDGGSIRVFGFDPHREITSLHDRIGVQLQEAELQKRIKVWEAVDLCASLYKNPVDGGALLEQLGLADKLNTRFMNLSGGQKQRLFIALALINDPEMVFLDELTTGLDPQARRTIWDLVWEIKAHGKTVFLTTHLMEEAEILCDRVAIMEHGKVIAMDSPKGLVREHCPERTVLLSTETEVAREEFEGIAHMESTASVNGSLVLKGNGDAFVSEVIHFLSEKRIKVTSFRTEEPKLEDVFLKLTGRSIRD